MPQGLSPDPIDRSGPFRSRLWTPWRMTYVGGESSETGCVFCNRRISSRDVDSLIVYRGESTFVLLNLYPYNTGHVMLVPNPHVADLAALEPSTLAEMGDLTVALTTALRRILDCDGFNVGMNIGAAAGAGIAEHLHQHIVPRWNGDANFMPIVGSTKVLPETLPATYARIRAEFCRERSAATRATGVVFDTSLSSVLINDDALPVISLDTDIPVWRSLREYLGQRTEGLQVAGWAGSEESDADSMDAPAVAFIATGVHSDATAFRMAPLDRHDLSTLQERDRQLITLTRERLRRL